MSRSASLLHYLSSQMILVGLLPLLLVVGLTFFLIRPEIIRNVEARHQSVATAVAGQVDVYLSSAARELSDLRATLASHGAGDPEHISADLDLRAGFESLFETLYLLDGNSIVMATGLPESRRFLRQNLNGLDMSGNRFVQVTREYQQPVWSDTFLSTLGGELSVALALPVPELGPGMVLVGEIGIEGLSAIVADIERRTGLQILILDRKSQLVAHPDVSLAVQQLNLGYMDMIRDVLGGEIKTHTYSQMGVERLGTLIAISNLEWVLLASEPTSRIYRPFILAGWITLAGISIGVLISFIISFNLAARLARRIANYSQHAERMAGGSRTLEWPVSNIEELQSLATSLQSMSDEIDQREQQLSKSEAQFRELVEDIQDLVTKVDSKGRFVYVNHASRAVFGVEPEQCIGLSAFEFIHPDDRKSTTMAFENWLEFGDANFLLENRQLSRNGTVHVIDWSIRAHRDDRGNVIDFVSIGRDITQQLKSKQALIERERRYRALIEQSPIGVIEWDLEFRVMEWNKAAERIFGYARDDALGMRAQDLSPPEEHDSLERTLNLLLNRSGGQRNENVNITRDGHRLTCQWYNRPLVNDDLKVTGVISLVEDITQRKLIEQELRDSEDKFSTLFQASPVPVIVISHSDNDRLIDCNQAWEQVFNRRRNAVLADDKAVAGLWSDDGDRERIWQVLTDTGAIHSHPARLLCGDEQRQFEISGQRIQMGQAIWFLLTLIDITEQQNQQRQIEHLNASLEERVRERTQELTDALQTLRRTQTELIQSEKLAALGGMVAGIAHELSTPIGNALMAASTFSEHTRDLSRLVESQKLKRSDLDNYADDALTSTDILLRNLERASELITSFKQVAVDQTSQKRRQFILSEVVQEIVTTLRPLFKRTPYRIEMAIADKITLDSYPGPLGQILTNLIKNAVVHGFEGRDTGTVTLSAELVTEDQVRLRVCDDGKGVSLEDQQKLFDPFFTTKMGQGGSGLGLNIVHNLTTKVLGGQISFDSTPGQGTCFTLLLPLSPAAPAAADSSPPAKVHSLR